MKTRVFLYGTLKRGQRSHHLLHGQEFLGEAKTLPVYRLYNCGQHPALVEDPQNGVAVHGEVWLANDETVQKLDAYEEAPRYFSRRPILLQSERGTSSDHSPDSEVQAYFFNGDVANLRDAGDRWPPLSERLVDASG
jgi:gamma-glutamylaminecyclotransferase